MSIRKLFDLLVQGRSRGSGQPGRRGTCARRPGSRRLALESLECRLVPTSLSIGDVTVIEGVSGTKYERVTVRLSEATTNSVTVNYNTANGSALAGSDYNKVSGKLTFAPGETSRSILVTIRGDQVAESTEQFSVNLSRAKNATIADGQGIITITDSTAPVITISHEQQGESATDSFMTFTVSLSVASSETVTVNFATRDGYFESEYADGAYAGQDYVAASGTLTFAPGETSKQITIQIRADGIPEYDEFFYVDLSGVSANAQLGFVKFGQGFIYGEFGVPI